MRMSIPLSILRRADEVIE